MPGKQMDEGWGLRGLMPYRIRPSSLAAWRVVPRREATGGGAFFAFSPVGMVCSHGCNSEPCTRLRGSIAFLRRLLVSLFNLTYNKASIGPPSSAAGHATAKEQ
jgi:hypothetical protein